MRSLYRFLCVVIAGACIVGALGGCSKAPDQELTAAKEAVKAAQDAEADKYMPNNFQNVKKALTAAEVEIELQNNAFFLSRNYSKAKQLLRNARELATQITTDLPQAKADMKAQIEESLASAKKVAKDTRVDIKKAPRSKGKEALAQMAKDIDAADSAIEEAEADYKAGNVLGARKKLADAQRLLKKIFNALSTGGTDGLM